MSKGEFLSCLVQKLSLFSPNGFGETYGKVLHNWPLYLALSLSSAFRLGSAPAWVIFFFSLEGSQRVSHSSPIRLVNFVLFFLLSSSTLFDRSGEYHSIKNKKKVAIQFQFELGSNLLSIDRREQTAILLWPAWRHQRKTIISGYDHSFIR